MGQDKLVDITSRGDERIQGMIYTYSAEPGKFYDDPDRLSVWSALESERQEHWAQYHTIFWTDDPANLDRVFWSGVWELCARNGWRVVDVRDDSIWQELWHKAQPDIQEDVNGWYWDKIKAEIEQADWYEDFDERSREMRAICLGSEWSILPTEYEINPDGREYDVWQLPDGSVHLHYADGDPCQYHDLEELTAHTVEYDADDPEWRHFYVEEWESAMSDAAGAVGLCFWFESGDGFVGEYRDKNQDDDDDQDDDDNPHDWRKGHEREEEEQVLS